MERTPPFELRVAERGWLTLVRAWTWATALRPAYVLTGFVVVQALATLGLALSVHRNGWLFYQGGDQTFYYSTAWALGHGHLPRASIGYTWSLLEAPVALFAGPSFLAALPAVILFETLVLAPLGLIAVYGIAGRIGGRALGYVAAAGWVVAPYLVIPGFVHRFHAVYVDQVLPQALGLTGLGDFASMIVVAVAAWLFLRALDGGGDGDAVLAGLLTGVALGLKAANAPFLAGPALALLVVRRWRVGAAYTAALAPALLTLVVWKARGLGYLPLLQHAPAGGPGPAAIAPVGILGIALRTYLHFDWGQLGRNMDQFREFFWSMRLVEWLPFAGLVAVARASLAKAAMLGGWLGAFVVVKAASPAASVQDGTFFRLMMPAWPAYLLLAASLPLLVPGVAPRLSARVQRPPMRPVGVRSRGLLVAACLLGLVPLVVISALPRLSDRSVATDFSYNTVLPTTVDLHLRATANPDGTVSLRWRPPPGRSSSRVFYRVYSAPTVWDAGLGLPRSVDEITCDPAAHGAAKCTVTPNVALDPERATALVDHPGGPGERSYRVAVLANWLDDPSQGDTFLLSRPARVLVR